MEEAPKLEPGPQKDEVMALFKTFDIEGTGKIEMKGLKAVKVEVGPSKMSVLDQLAEMDFNGDGYVEKDEWEMYFATVVAALDADSLKIILDDLKEAGRYDYSFSPLPVLTSFLTLVACLHSTYATIANCVKMAEADDVTGGEPTEETELSEEESAAVKKLFEGWDFNGDGTIALSTLLTTGVDIGPRKEKVSKQSQAKPAAKQPGSNAARSNAARQQRRRAAASLLTPLSPLLLPCDDHTGLSGIGADGREWRRQGDAGGDDELLCGRQVALPDHRAVYRGARSAITAVVRVLSRATSL